MTGAPPTDLLFGPPALTAVRPSPDGTRVAYLAPCAGVMTLWVSQVDGAHARPLADGLGSGWSSAPHWTADSTALLCLRDPAGDELHHLWHVDVTTGHARDLTPHEHVQAQLVGTSRRRPASVAVALNLDDPTRHDLYVIDLDSGELQGPTSRGATRFSVDADLQPAFMIRLRADGAAELCGPAAEPFDVVPAGDTVSLILGQLDVSDDGRLAYVLHSAGQAAVALHRYDVTTGSRQTVHADPDHDVAAFSRSPVTGEVDLVRVDGQRRQWHGEGAAELNADTCDVSEVHRSDDDLTWVVVQVADDAPPVHEVRDRRTGTRRQLAERPQLSPYRLARTAAVTVPARDGLPIPAYLTLPPDGPGERLPAVVWVHGGPWSRDHWGFDPIVQLMATRGYAVVQVNYRGSTGYGRAFLDAGDREWGAAMQTDLADVVDHLCTTGAVDRSRVAIAGGSYGGYATLMGLVTDPSRYACGIAWCAPSNLLTLLRSFPPYWAPLLAHWHARVGHPDSDAEILTERSPLTHLQRLSVPLLLVHGANDPRVLVEESRAVASALAERGLPHVYHEVPGEGHGFSKPENNVWLLEQISAFLDMHLPA